MNTTIKNYHVLIVRFLNETDNTKASILINSPYLKSTKVIPFNPNHGNDTCEIAEHWLTSKGFNVVGHADGKNCYFIITDTFLKLDHYKQIVTKPA